MPLPAIAISVEAGGWPPEEELRVLCERAVVAAARAFPPPLRGRVMEGGPPTPPPVHEHHAAERLGAAQTGRIDLPSSPLPGPSPQGGREGARLDGSELSILFTDDAAIRRLNARWRGKDAATNVLSFPQPDGALLGDIVLADETVRREAALAGKPVEEHIAHLVIHGLFHLLGYDHEDEHEADAMEHMETAAMAEMGLADPYRPHEDR